jgi:hypothetical protein
MRRGWFRARDQALRFARETRSRFPFLVAARSRSRRHHRRRFLPQQPDRRNVDSFVRAARNFARTTRARRLAAGNPPFGIGDADSNKRADKLRLANQICMRAIWKGSISFGLVNIPIALYPATRKEELKFRLLRAKDLSPVNYKRVAEKDGKEVPWGEIVKGYEYEKGKYVVLKDEDFQRVDLEATQTVDIQDFVLQEEIDPMFFYKPYYLEPQKGGDKAYVLLRDTLEKTGQGWHCQSRYQNPAIPGRREGGK